MIETRTVDVVVYEDGEEVGSAAVTYFDGQPYTVKIDTPDGVDAEVTRQVGGPPAVNEKLRVQRVRRSLGRLQDVFGSTV